MAQVFAIDAGTGEVTLTADGATALNNDALTSTSTTIGVTVSDGTLSSSEAPLEIKFDAEMMHRRSLNPHLSPFLRAQALKAR